MLTAYRKPPKMGMTQKMKRTPKIKTTLDLRKENEDDIFLLGDVILHKILTYSCGICLNYLL